MRRPCIATKSNACSPQREKAHAHQRSPITAIQKQKHPARLRPSGFQQRAPAPRLGRGPQCGLMHRLLEGAQGLELLPPSFIVSTPPRGVAGLSLPPILWLRAAFLGDLVFCCGLGRGRGQDTSGRHPACSGSVSSFICLCPCYM